MGRRLCKTAKTRNSFALVLRREEERNTGCRQVKNNRRHNSKYSHTAYPGLGAVLSSLYMSAHLILTTGPRGSFYHPPSETYEETETWKFIQGHRAAFSRAGIWSPAVGFQSARF